MYPQIGDEVKFSKTVGETDVYLFAGVTGDFSVNHVNEEVMSRSMFGRRIAHGALLVGFMSTASTMMIEKCVDERDAVTPASLGYDRVRFVAPVFLGDTITVYYRITHIDEERQRSLADVRVVNQHGVTTAVASHILKWTPNPQTEAQRQVGAETQAR